MTKEFVTDRSIIQISDAFYVTVPKLWAKANNIKKGSMVRVTAYSDHLDIRPVKK